MNKLITILLFFSSTVSAQKPFGILINKPAPPLLIIFAGESNSGGLADNTFATIGERAPRNLKILNNANLYTFDPLDIGTNNLVNHVGLNYVQITAHGWELELANRYDQRTFGGRPVYLCKAGQGGTTIAMWADEATYSAESQTIEPYDVFIQRVQRAIFIIDSTHGRAPDVVMFWSLGINDMGIDTDPTTFKNATKDVFDLMRTDLGITLPIIMTQFQSINPTYDDELEDITNEMDNVYVVNTTGAETSYVVAGVGTHWGYHGMKQIADDLIDLLLTIL